MSSPQLTFLPAEQSLAVAIAPVTIEATSRNGATASTGGGRKAAPIARCAARGCYVEGRGLSSRDGLPAHRATLIRPIRADTST